MYTVVIVDDEPWALQGLAEIIDWNNEGFSIIGQFTDPDEAFEFLCKKEPDVVFTDIRMPGLSGLDLIEMPEYVITVMSSPRTVTVPVWVVISAGLVIAFIIVFVRKKRAA